MYSRPPVFSLDPRCLSEDPTESNFHRALNALLAEVKVAPGLNENDLRVALVLVNKMHDGRVDVASMSLSEICKNSHLSIGAVRHSLKKLQKAGYLKVIQPSEFELRQGGWTLKYRAGFYGPVGFPRAA
ncbi:MULTISPECIES: winged helix-turn-helix domain-containing protein [Bradyrhizobium]|uniref:winged helix-turn-helix domain-containing protein n=1 Tax=Bradyrhizobium TaxID=374 RepID=UPI000231D867|nr:winged helix-turn-helix domain-containing protein [Bradyrhizobium japonicum]MCS3986866.1 DNA-binding transcriptional ArsR family regulator [Bradyrhizobium japonicum]MCS4018317.1 DNA-binding transcriptional ArsR family regulator [Bradyrhizobium japonicum]MDH6178720.1 DNA-binding transcriptional ArsR family regulator [Bradyrhizobium japonicum]BAL13496.1 hypothetical protein BJ6T_82520 [Bradyrhizobium japonicum USDA 6]GEC47292.1 hypothetical protein BJA01nite_49340 [Bradyrhizobium japonicum]